MTDPRKRWKRPKAGSTWTDVKDRVLSVESVNPHDRAGRQVVGTIKVGGDSPQPYSCDLLIWADVWRDRVQRLTPSEMKIG